MQTTILGAGISGLSTAYHIGHDQCQIFEERPVRGGHAGSELHFGFTVDKGPHVSFTSNDYVKNLFANHVQEDFNEFGVTIKNFYQGKWLHHPAQYHLWQVGGSLADICAKEMLDATERSASDPTNYKQWLHDNLGKTFAQTFAEPYTLKYWTTPAENLTIDWLGPRVKKPTKKEILGGMVPGTINSTHYITNVRYPKKGGFQSFFDPLARSAHIKHNRTLTEIDLDRKRIRFQNGDVHTYERIVSTVPLPDFVMRSKQASDEIKEAASLLDCTQLLLVDVFVPYSAQIDGNWFYVYDEDKWATRIHYIERLEASNTPSGWSGIQAEVYFSKYREFPGDPLKIAEEVVLELAAMGFIPGSCVENRSYYLQWRWCPYANVTFTHPRREALETIWSWLEQYGLARRVSDIDPMSDWSAPIEPEGTIMMAGRFAEWKYYWTDDCVLRGKQIAESLRL